MELYLYQQCFETNWTWWSNWSRCSDDCLGITSNGTRTRMRYNKEDLMADEEIENCKNECFQPKSSTQSLSGRFSLLEFLTHKVKIVLLPWRSKHDQMVINGKTVLDFGSILVRFKCE